MIHVGLKYAECLRSHVTPTRMLKMYKKRNFYVGNNYVGEKSLVAIQHVNTPRPLYSSPAAAGWLAWRKLSSSPETSKRDIIFTN